MKRLAASVIKNVSYPFIRMYFGARSCEPIWLHVLNAKGRRLHRDNLPRLDAIQKRIVGDLMRDGIASAHIDELFPEQHLLPALQRYVTQGIKKAETKTQKKFLQQLWDVTPLVDFENKLMRLPLEPRIIDMVNAYMGMYSRLYYLTLNVTTPVAPDAPAVSSQRWHRDPEDRKMCKLFLYLNDVDEDAGPFQYIIGSHRQGRYGKRFPQHPPKGTFPGDDIIARAMPSSAIRSYTGPAGTIIFADTSGLHKGGYATTKERIMFTGGFCSSASVWPIRLAYPEDFSRQLMRISISRPAVSFALKPIPRSFSTRLFDRIRKVYTYE